MQKAVIDSTHLYAASFAPMCVLTQCSSTYLHDGFSDGLLVKSAHEPPCVSTEFRAIEQLRELQILIKKLAAMFV